MKKFSPLYTNLAFSDYVQQTKNTLRQSREESVMEANAPYELRPNNPRCGILLIHGLLESAFITRDIGTALYEQNYWVRALLLPGHGSVPSDLLNIHYQDWLEATRYGVESFGEEKVIIIGMSTGAILAVAEALKGNSNIAGLVLIAPAFKINTMFDFASNLHRLISWKYPRAAWMNREAEKDNMKYRSMPFNAAYQVYLLTKKIQRIDTLPCPSLFIISRDDSIVSSKKTLAYFQTLTHTHHEMIYYTSKPTSFSDRRITVRSSVYPAQHILNLSHIAIPVSPENPHYGDAGDCPFASHVSAQPEFMYGELNKRQQFIYDALYRWGFIQFPRRRLTFNPDFHFMMQKILDFVRRVNRPLS